MRAGGHGNGGEFGDIMKKRRAYKPLFWIDLERDVVSTHDPLGKNINIHNLSIINSFISSLLIFYLTYYYAHFRLQILLK
jgi:hypothetical protein